MTEAIHPDLEGLDPQEMFLKLSEDPDKYSDNDLTLVISEIRKNRVCRTERKTKEPTKRDAQLKRMDDELEALLD